MDLKRYLSERKKLIEDAIERYFMEYSGVPEKLKESMLYSLRAGGKRLRPVLVLAATEACGGDLNKAMPVALALEMIHTFSLIHDDLPAMDDDDLRRGVPTNHKKFGDAVAILAGDGLLAEAFSCLASGMGGGPLGNGKNGKGQIVEVIADIARAAGAKGMTGGQAMDLEAEGKKVSYEELRSIHSFKTGALITVAVTSGAKIAGASAEKIECLRKYGESIGLAFQITDDILDIEGTTEELGKPAKSDVENRKSTYPSVLGIERSKKLAKELVDKAYSALAEFDSKADPLREIARYILTRKS